MNETERADKIGKAACDGHPTITDHWDSLDEILQSSWIEEGIAAVRAAYEIDGVGELLDDVEVLCKNSEAMARRMPMSLGYDITVPHNVGIIRAAAARVREAMGDGE